MERRDSYVALRGFKTHQTHVHAESARVALTAGRDGMRMRYRERYSRACNVSALQQTQQQVPTRDM